MIPSGVKVFLASHPIDFRKGPDSLLSLVRDAGSDPFNGALYVFRAKRADRVKIVWWDGSGVCLYATRLEKAQFCWPRIGHHRVQLNHAQLLALVDGMDWKRVRSLAMEWQPVLQKAIWAGRCFRRNATFDDVCRSRHLDDIIVVPEGILRPAGDDDTELRCHDIQPLGDVFSNQHFWSYLHVLEALPVRSRPRRAQEREALAWPQTAFAVRATAAFRDPSLDRRNAGHDLFEYKGMLLLIDGA